MSNSRCELSVNGITDPESRFLSSIQIAKGLPTTHPLATVRYARRQRDEGIQELLHLLSTSFCVTMPEIRHKVKDASRGA
jgi:hypothetical protein